MNREEEIFEAAAALPETGRAAYLDGACAGQPQMRARIAALLRSHDVQGFMDGATRAADAEAEQAGMPQEQGGQRIGRYKLLEQIGEGGFGVVWVAEQLEPVRRRVALKIIKPGMDSREVIARFEAERQALAMMDHPNIAKVFDAGTTEAGRPYFAMELVRGVRITEFCDQAHLPTEERLRLFATVCQAVQHAHQKGIIHRDLKPSNILVAAGDDGQPAPKVIDFGVAKAIGPALTDGTVYTRFEQMIGTPAYMSPEQAGLGPMDIDTRSDIYSLGVLLYELLTGRPPFDPKELLDAGLDEMRRVIREVEPPKPSTRLTQRLTHGVPALAGARPPKGGTPNIADDLDWIVMKAIEKDRTRRYETANGLALDIQRFLADETVSAGPPTAGYRFRKFAHRNRTALRVAAAVAAVLIAATVVSTSQAVRATTAGNLAEKRLGEKEQALRDAEDISTFLSEIFQSPDPTRDGRTIVVADSLDHAAKQMEADLASQPGRRARLQAALVRTYVALGLHPQAILLQERVREYHLSTSGPDHPSTLAAMDALAAAYSRAGRHAEALKLQEELLTRTRTVSGLEHESTLMAMNGIATSYSHLGREAEALETREKVLALGRKLHGPDHTTTLMAMLNLANSYFESGRLEEAIRLQEEVLTHRRRVLGLEHPRTLDIMQNLANSYREAGREVQALALSEEAVALSRKVNGPEHPATLGAMHGLASSYHSDTGRRAEALKLREEVVRLSRKVNGPEHPETVAMMHDLANSYDSDAGHRDDALGMQEEVLRLSRRVNGPEHPHTLRAVHNLASSYFTAGRRDEALAMREEVLTLRRRISGSEHSETLGAMHSLAGSYSSAGRTTEAIEMQEKVVTRRRQRLGSEHPDTLRGMRALALYCVHAGRHEEALALQEEALPLHRRVFGPEHPETLEAMQNVSNSYFHSDRTDEAIEMGERVVSLSRKLNGPESPKTLGAAMSLATFLNQDGRLVEAIRLQEEALAVKRRVLPRDHEYLVGGLTNMALLYEQAGRISEAETLRRELAELEGPAPSAAGAAAEALSVAPQPTTAPVEQERAHMLVAPNSEWRWLHPTDGSDPGEQVPGFHTAFCLPGFDDSKWARGTDSDGPTGGFGYGLRFTGVDIGWPEDKTHRWSAYFRHAFTTERGHSHLELRCQRDDGIIVYLDGKEVVRDNVELGEEAYRLRAVEAVDEDDDSVVRRYPIPGELAPGPHVLAISVHNSSPASTDLRLGGVSLVDVESQGKPD